MSLKVFISLVLTSFLISCGEPEKELNTEDNLVAQAKIMSSYFLEGDLNSFISYTYTPVVELMGGKDSLINLLNQGTQQMANQGMTISTLEFGKPSAIIEINNQLQAILPQKMMLKIPSGMLQTNSSLVCISADNGERWFFVEATGKNIDQMREMIPSLSPDLFIPKATEPLLFENPN